MQNFWGRIKTIKRGLAKWPNAVKSVLPAAPDNHDWLIGSDGAPLAPKAIKGWLTALSHLFHRVWFKMRIRIEVFWRLSWLWWDHFRLGPYLWKWLRPALLLVFGLGLPFLALEYWLAPGLVSGFSKQLAELLVDPTRPLDWRSAGQFFLIIGGAAIAFVVWAFRDANAQQQIENQRKDVNLKEFQEIQSRAAGLLDPALPQSARDTLQIAALHQLRGFLRGEYGVPFQKPALELLLSGHEEACARLGVGQIGEWLESDKARDNPEIIGVEIERTLEEIAANEGVVDRVRRQIIGEEWHAIFRKDHDLRQRQFARIEFPAGIILAKLDLSGTDFTGASLRQAYGQFADFDQSNFYGADLTDASLHYAHLRRAELHHAHLSFAELQYANLSGAELHHADLSESNWQQAVLTDAEFNQHTILLSSSS